MNDIPRNKFDARRTRSTFWDSSLSIPRTVYREGYCIHCHRAVYLFVGRQDDPAGIVGWRTAQRIWSTLYGIYGLPTLYACTECYNFSHKETIRSAAIAWMQHATNDEQRAGLSKLYLDYCNTGTTK